MPPARQDLRQGHFIVRVREELVNVGHRITRCNVNLSLSVITPLQHNSCYKDYLVSKHGQRYWSCCWFMCGMPNNRALGLMSKVFANGPRDMGSIPGWVMPKTRKMVLDTALLSTQHYKVRIKGKVEESKEKSSALPYTLV